LAGLPWWAWKTDIAILTNFYTNDIGGEDGFGIDRTMNLHLCGTYNTSNDGDGELGIVRCYRTL
jgi:hypothetical protein